ncbi:methyltransferase domain-containing protein [Candidatus Saganbacteria bacterium]|nr:methyltransferase domain-containing protein [Candidatus Saganbacteria bacterium]
MIRATEAKRITSWREAYRRNYVLNSGDKVDEFDWYDTRGREIRASRIFTTPEGGRLTAEQKAEIRSFVDFVRRQQVARHSDDVEREWRGITALKRGRAFLYAPRHSHLLFKFRREYDFLFAGRRVLDIGCAVEDGRSAFYSYYRGFGASAVGIDLSVEDNPNEGIFKGDARMLAFPDRSFDFVTLPMIYGLNNPAETVLEIAAGLSELHRVLDNGLVHIADPILLPGLVYIANMLGFRCFYNYRWHDSADDWNGIPVGSLLMKKDAPLPENPFQAVVSDCLREREISFSAEGTDELPFRELITTEPD